MNKTERFINEWPIVEDAFRDWNDQWKRYTDSCCNGWTWTPEDSRKLMASKDRMDWVMFKAFSKIYHSAE